MQYYGRIIMLELRNNYEMVKFEKGKAADNFILCRGKVKNPQTRKVKSLRENYARKTIWRKNLVKFNRCVYSQQYLLNLYGLILDIE